MHFILPCESYSRQGKKEKWAGEGIRQEQIAEWDLNFTLIQLGALFLWKVINAQLVSSDHVKPRHVYVFMHANLQSHLIIIPMKILWILSK